MIQMIENKMQKKSKFVSYLDISFNVTVCAHVCVYVFAFNVNFFLAHYSCYKKKNCIYSHYIFVHMCFIYMCVVNTFDVQLL